MSQFVMKFICGFYEGKHWISLYLFVFDRISECPLCKKRFMSRLNGPLHLSADDFPSSSEANENDIVDEHAEHVAEETNNDCERQVGRDDPNQQNKDQSDEQNENTHGIMDGEPPRKCHVRDRSKSVHEWIQNDANTQNESSTNIQQAAVRQRCNSIPPIKNTIGCKANGRNRGRDYDRNVILALDDWNPPVHDLAPRRSDRIRRTTQRYNIAEVKCFVCKKKYRQDISMNFFDERIACSFKCLRNVI